MSTLSLIGSVLQLGRRCSVALRLSTPQAAAENLDFKRGLFAQIEELARPDTLLPSEIASEATGPNPTRQFQS